MTIFLGNERVREKILADALTKKLPHAILISGPKGIGKFSFLKFLTEKIINKEEKKFFPPEVMIVDELFQYGKKDQQEEVLKKSFFDQSHRKKFKKKSNSIGVEDLEKFVKHLFETTPGEYKVILIRDVERMTRETSHKFLKILEEPPQKTLFLMTCSSEKKLLDTFLSRVRREYFSLVSPNIIKNFLKNNTLTQKFSSNEKKELEDLAEGRGEYLQKMIQNKKFFEEEKAKKNKAEKIFTMTKGERMEISENLAKQEIEEIFDILYLLKKFLRKKLRKSLLEHKKNTVSKKIIKLSQAKNFLIKNGNKRMILENLFLYL